MRIIFKMKEIKMKKKEKEDKKYPIFQKQNYRAKNNN